MVAAEGWRCSGTQVGVITNPTGVLTNLISIVDAMVASGASTSAGVRSRARLPRRGPGRLVGGHLRRRAHGVTVYDAYGANATKFARLFTDPRVETVVFDIQDVGARFYTYIWTMYTAMIARRRGRRLVRHLGPAEPGRRHAPGARC